jgi:DNA mismatch repair protein MutL
MNNPDIRYQMTDVRKTKSDLTSDICHLTSGGIIRRLPETLVNRIAAGEVIERPAAAVKELVENAIDAGASRIDVRIEEGGQRLISVTDNGRGMRRDELDLAVERHATSKLPNDEALNRIATLGFRGEALPSIGSVARLTITSRALNADDAWMIEVNAGVKSPPKPAALGQGTRVEVRDLFHATPARLKFLKQPRTEAGHVREAVERLALAYPGIAFSLTDDERTIFKLEQTTGDLLEERLPRIGAIFGRDFLGSAVAVTAEREELTLTGFAGLPTLHRPTAMYQWLYVNGRPVRDRLFSGAVRAGYGDNLMSGRHPMTVLFLDIPGDLVDVNVHPAKAEVRFRDAGMVRGLIVSALRHTFAGAELQTSSALGEHTLAAFRPAAQPFQYQQSYTPSRNYGSAGFAEPRQAEFVAGPPAAPAAEVEAIEAAADFPLGAARAQLHETYIVAQTPTGMVIIDQHAAHERLVYEQMKAAYAAGGMPAQGLLLPEIVELDERDVDLLVAKAADLTRLGLDLDRFGPGAVVVRSVPSLLGDADVTALVKDLAEELREQGESELLAETLDAVCATLSCHGSVRAGRKLNIDEMNALLRQMEQTPNASQCNHGRPTHIELRLSDIEKLFARR